MFRVTLRTRSTLGYPVQVTGRKSRAENGAVEMVMQDGRNRHSQLRVLTFF